MSQPDNDVMLMALLSLRGRTKSREEYEAAVAALQEAISDSQTESEQGTSNEE